MSRFILPPDSSGMNGTDIAGGHMPMIAGMSQPSPPMIDSILPDDMMPPDGAMPGGMPQESQDPDQILQINLATILPETYLTTLGADVVRDTDDDIEARQPMFDRFTRGLEMMGLLTSDQDDGAFPGASTVVMPLLSDAVTHHWARGLGETWPSEGPARAKTLGQSTSQNVERATRVADYINYQMMFEDDAGYEEHRRLMWIVPFKGCAFKKTYHDADLDRTSGVCVDPDDLIVPPRASSLKTAPRFTHRIYKTENEIKRLQRAGFYRKIDIGEPSARDTASPLEVLDKLEATSASTDEDSFELYEQYVELDIPGFPDIDPRTGETTGVAMPYVVTVERNSRKVLAIYGNWKPKDAMKRRRVFFSKYGFVPGKGYYDLGLIHLLGGLQMAATGALRELLDAGSLSSLQGGFLTKDANLSGDRIEIEPGVWKPINASREELAGAFFSPPFKEPSAAIMQLLPFLISQAQKFVGTTDMQTGDASAQNAPVGSVVAILEQGSKLYTTIHRGYHDAMQEELRLRYELSRDRIGIAGAAYPYDVEGQPRQVFASDFGPGVDIQPVSDPNIFSSTQRLALAQAGFEVSMKLPQIVDQRVAAKRLFQAMRMPDIGELMPDKNKPPPHMDPVTENGRLLASLPIKAYPDQDHLAHIHVHAAFLSSPQFGGQPDVQKAILDTMKAHLGEHLAYLYIANFTAQGVPVPPVDPMTGDYAQPPQIDLNQVAQMAAQIAPNLINAPGLPQISPPDQQSPVDLAKAKQMEAEGQVRIQHQQETHAMNLKYMTDVHQEKMKQLQDGRMQKSADAQVNHQLTVQEAIDEATKSHVQQQQDAFHKEQAHQLELAQQQTAHAHTMVETATSAEQNRQIADMKAESDRLNASKMAAIKAKPSPTKKKKT